jgi:hypothetical protein
MTKAETTLKVFSTLAILVPIIIGAYRLKATDTLFQLFFLFLIIGFIIDSLSWYLIQENNKHVMLIIFNIYSIIEASVFLWFVVQPSSNFIQKGLYVAIQLFLSMSWAICFFLSFHIQSGGSPSGIFVALYEVIISFMAGMALLKIIETNDSIVISNPKFWILLGVFFYCFCSFFIMGFLETIVAQRVWFFSNGINIITYIFYSVGLYKINKPTIRTGG